MVDYAVDPTIIPQWAPVIAVGVSLLALTLSYRAYKGSYASSKSQMLFAAMNHYISIQKDRTTAIEKKDKDLCKQYYRQMFDLYWAEYKLWELGYIDNDCMKTWMKMAAKNYYNDFLTAKNGENTPEIKIYYREEWDELVKSKYFSQYDNFVSFLNRAHDNDIEEALKERKKKFKF